MGIGIGIGHRPLALPCAEAGLRRALEIVLQTQDQPIAGMHTKVGRDAAVRRLIAIAHLALRVADTAISQLNSQRTVLAAQVCRLGNRAARRRTRADFVRGVLRERSARGKSQHCRDSEHESQKPASLRQDLHSIFALTSPTDGGRRSSARPERTADCLLNHDGTSMNRA